MGAGLDSDQQYKADRRECEGNQLPDLPWRDRHDLRSLSTDPTMTKTTRLNHSSASVDPMQRPAEDLSPSHRPIHAVSNDVQVCSSEYRLDSADTVL